MSSRTGELRAVEGSQPAGGWHAQGRPASLPRMTARACDPLNLTGAHRCSPAGVGAHTQAKGSAVGVLGEEEGTDCMQTAIPFPLREWAAAAANVRVLSKPLFFQGARAFI